MWTAETSQGNEAGKIKWDIVPYTRGLVLDLGSGPFKPFPHFIGIDLRQEWTALDWKPDIMRDCTDLSFIASKAVDAVFSSHLLEHLKDHEAAIREWWRVIKVGGYLVLYLPHADLYPRMGQPGTNPDHVHDFMPEDIEAVMKGLGGWDLVENETRSEKDEYSFFQVYRKRKDHEQQHPHKKRKTQKTCAVVRYGGFGDMLQAASIFPQLKEEGYHITVVTTPQGKEVIKHDPHVDEFYLQDKDQVKMEELGQFWNSLKRKFDKFVNLTESVEVAMLVPPGMTCHRWPKASRAVRFNMNYLELTSIIAEVPYRKPARSFYPSDEEAEWAAKEYRTLEGKVVLWCLSGSSLHKTWPYMDSAIASLLVHAPKDLKIVLVGDELSQVLETGWEEEPRVVRKCGKWSIRETLAFADLSDIVIGPETGVLNSVAFMLNWKIICLSHSSPENLTRDWVNSITLTPTAECYPCHQLNERFSEYQCTQDPETGTAACQASIPPSKMAMALTMALEKVYAVQRRIING